MTERATLTDPSAVVDRMAADIAEIAAERESVTRDDIAGRGWLYAQIDRYGAAAVIVAARAFARREQDAQPARPNAIVQAAHTARALAGDALEIAALALFVGAILLATPAARVLA